MDIITTEEITVVGEQVVVAGGLPLVLSFEPEAVIQHFEDDPAFSQLIEGLSREELATVGYAALVSDALYETFHAVLVAALDEVAASKG